MSFILFLVSARQPYVTSIFGREGINDVINEYVDGIEILEHNLLKQQTKHIKELKLTELIPDNAYPWPGNNLKVNFSIIQQETRKIKSLYGNNKIKPNQNYYHPAADKQFYTTFEELNKSERVKVRFTTTPKVSRHYAHVFMPPGEIATVSIKEEARNKVWVTYNKYMSPIWSLPNGSPKFGQRLDDLRIDSIKLNDTVNTLALPYGAYLNFDINGDNPIEINISGVILCPSFTYGVDSDEDWENNQVKLPGPVAVLNPGNIIMSVPSKYVRDKIRMNDCMKFYRSDYQISQTTTSDGYNSKWGRPTNLLEMNYETFVPAGAAVAFVGRNFIHYPPSWIGGATDWNSIQDNPWGNLHEMNHHHQGSWANGGVDEMSNNVLNLIIYAKSNQASSKRNINGGLSDWKRYSTGFQLMNSPGNAGYPLTLYSTFLHFFGIDKMQEFIRSDQDNTLYNRNDVKIGRRGAQLLRASKIFGRNMHWEFNYQGYNDTDIDGGRTDTLVWSLLKELNLPDFHPVSNPYATGFLDDNGTEYETVRPFQIFGFPTEIDFNKTMRQRNRRDLFGAFVFQKAEFEHGRESAWKQLSEGKYLMTPTNNQTHNEKVIVHYLDQTTQKTTKVICKFMQMTNFARYSRYSNIGNISDVMSAYKFVLNITAKTVEEKTISKIESTQISTDRSGWLTITKGKISVPDSKSYNFSIKSDDQGLFYLSENELTSDPDLDSNYLILKQDKFNYDYTKSNHSSPIFLNQTEHYHFLLVIFNPSNSSSVSGKGVIGYQTGKNSWADVPNSWLRGLGLTDKEIWDNQYRPNFTDMYSMDEWHGRKLIKIENITLWKVLRCPKGSAIIDSKKLEGKEDKSKTVNDVLFDDKPDTEWRSFWFKGEIEEFPHIFDIDFGENVSFDAIEFGLTGNPALFATDSDIDIRFSFNNDSIVDNTSVSNNSSTNFTRRINQANNVAVFDKVIKCRYLRIRFLNNRMMWFLNLKGKTSISSISIGKYIYNNKVRPTTVIYAEYNDKWKTTSDGHYYNRRGMIGTAGAELTFKIPKWWKEIDIIGDLYPWMGIATVTIDGEHCGTINN